MSMKKIIFVLILLFAVCGCGNDSEYKKVSVKAGSAPGKTEVVLTAAEVEPRKKNVLRVAIAPVISPKSSIVFYSDLIKYLSSRAGIEIDILQKGTYSETVELLRSGLCDMAFICSGAYVSARREFSLEVLVEPVVYGKPKYHSYLIVPADSGVKSMKELRGKNFAFTDPLSLSGYLYPLSVLKKDGENPDTYFSKVIFTKSHDYSIQAVAQKIVDAASVDSLVYEYLKIENESYVLQTKVISVSEPLSIPPVVVRGNLDAGVKKKILSTLLSMHLDELGLNIMRNIHVDSFVLPLAGDYDDVETIMKTAGRM